MNILNTIIGGISILDWGSYLLLSVLGFLVLKLAVRLLAEQLAGMAEKSETDMDDFLVRLLKSIHNLFLAGVSIWIGKYFFSIPLKMISVINLAAMFITLFQIGVSANVVIEFFLNRRLNSSEEKQTRQTTIRLMAKIISWFVWAVLVVMAADSIPGFNANTLITTLGIGGIAIAFALQNILSDVASALTIAFDQPFEEGDGIQVDDIGGTVEKIGLKSTRLRSWDGQEIIFSNSDLLKSRINNYKSLKRRRVLLNFGVVYDTSADALERIPGMVKAIVEQAAAAEFVWCYFTDLGDSALQYQAMYWINSTDFEVYLKARHTVHLGLLKEFEQAGIEFAYPTRTILLASHTDETFPAQSG